MKAEQLRKSILQLAIQGKLVPQDSNDESASVLLERIRAEKQQLIKEGKIKKDKNDSVIFKGDDNRYYEKVGSEVKDITDDLPFEIPDSWAWTKFLQIVSFELGKTPDRHTDKFWSNGRYPWFAISDLQERSIVSSTKEKISAVALKEKFAGKLVPQGTLLMSFKLTVGRTSILGVDAVHNEAIISVFPIIADKDATRNFLFNTLSLIVEYVETTDAIKGATLNSSKLSSMFVPLPPLAEQIRIVNEIKKFEPLIAEYDKLEQQATKLDDEIYDKLKKSILQYAIQGKLVPQDPNDEPASVLLERIRAEKKAKLGKKFVDSFIYKGDDNCYYEHIAGKAQDELVEVPFDIPDNWAWVRWGNLSFSIQYGYNAPAKESGRIKMVRISDIHNNEVDWEHVPFCDINETDIKTYLLKENDILFARTGGTVGKSYLVTYVPEEAIYAGYLIRTQYSAQLSAQYLKYFMESSLYWMQLKDGTIATAQPNCNGQTLSKMILPLPPLAEQKRVVAKINEIFAML